MDMNRAEMNFRLVLLLWLLNYSSAQDGNCDFYQSVPAGSTHYIYSPNYPYNYTPGSRCRWIVDCPAGYNCRMDCPEIRIPTSTSCSMDRLLVSRTGDMQLNGADQYCDTGSLSVTSTNQRLSIGLITSPSSPGGRFQCTVTTQAIVTPPSSCRCGERRQNRIVGGQETGVNEFTMMAGLADLRISQVKCGAVIISRRHVLSAAHCVVNQSVNNYGIVVGLHDVTNAAAATRAYAISRFTVHPYFTTSNYDYDIAVVWVALASGIEFSDLVQPVCLPFRFTNNNFAGTKVAVLGWGTLYAGGPSSNVLMKADLDVLQQSTCRSRGAAVTDRQMCTWTAGKDACQDDSGGPLLWTDPLTGALHNIGIVSFGRFCASDIPGTNTRVTAFLNWILSVTSTTENDYCIK